MNPEAKTLTEPSATLARLTGGTEFLGHPVWQWMTFAAYVAAGLLAAWIVSRVFAGWQRRLQRRSSAAWRVNVARLSRRPAALVVFLWLFTQAIHVIQWSPELATIFRHIITVAVTITVAIVAFGGVELIGQRMRDHLEPGEQVSYGPIIALTVTVAKIFLMVLAVIVAAQNLGIQVSGMLATLGIGGAAFALAAQETVANLIGCLVLLADRPFQIGDVIKMDALVGTVDRIGLRSTRLRSEDGTPVTVPNRTLVNGTIFNLSRTPGAAGQRPKPLVGTTTLSERDLK